MLRPAGRVEQQARFSYPPGRAWQSWPPLWQTRVELWQHLLPPPAQPPHRKHGHSQEAPHEGPLCTDRPRPRRRPGCSSCRHRHRRLRRHQDQPLHLDPDDPRSGHHLVLLRQLLRRLHSTCTSFEQLNLATAQGAQTLKRASGCALNITGGTEVGHASGTYAHWNGYKLDYSMYTCIGNYIKNNFSYSGLRGDGYPMWTSSSGNVYTDEGSHWDVLYYNCGGC